MVFCASENRGPSRPLIRTCVACRQRRDRSGLLRFQLDGGCIRRADNLGRVQGGRSVYLCPDHGCLRAVLRRGVLVFRQSKYAKIVVRLNQPQTRRLARAFRNVPVQ